MFLSPSLSFYSFVLTLVLCFESIPRMLLLSLFYIVQLCCCFKCLMNRFDLIWFEQLFDAQTLSLPTLSFRGPTSVFPLRRLKCFLKQPENIYHCLFEFSERSAVAAWFLSTALYWIWESKQVVSLYFLWFDEDLESGRVDPLPGLVNPLNNRVAVSTPAFTNGVRNDWIGLIEFKKLWMQSDYALGIFASRAETSCLLDGVSLKSEALT